MSPVPRKRTANVGFTIDTTKRYRAHTIHRLLISSGIVFLFILLFLIAGGIWSFTAFYEAPQALNSVIVFLLSIAAGLLLAFTYSSTSYPYRKPPHTVGDLLQANIKSSGNVADALSYHALNQIGTYLQNPDSEKIAKLADAITHHPATTEILQRFELNQDEVATALQANMLADLTPEQFAHTLVSQTATRGHKYINILDIFGVFMLHPNLHTFLRQNDLREQDISFGLWWHQKMKDTKQAQRRWWVKENLLNFTGVGLSWASGYTPFLDQFVRIPRGNLWDIAYGHIDQVEQLVNTLARQRQSNVLLVGQPGVGRLGVVRELATRVNHATAHPALDGQRVAYINISQIVATVGSDAQQLATLSKALDEMEAAGNIIAVLDGLGSVIGKGATNINVTDLLLPFFSSETVRVVVIMSSDEYHLRLKSNSELLHFFEVVQVPPLDESTALQLLALTSPEWEEKTELTVPYRSLREIVENTSSVLPYVPFPEKAFDLLDEAIVTAQGANAKSVTVEMINELIARKVGVDIGKFKTGEQQYLLRLEEVIHRRVVNQEAGVAAVARAMIRSRAGVRNRKRPIGTFLFLGPTGVGKTETAKALAEAYFGSDEYLQRLDMTQFQGEQGVTNLIGNVEGKPGQLTTLIADNPFSVLLLDEFEKADRLVKQIFMPVFDEGYLTDARGRRHSFSHTIIIATSNAGAELIRQNIQDDGKVPPEFDNQLREFILQQGIYRPEVLNRFDGVITFTPLTKEHIKRIAHLMLNKLNRRLDGEHGVTVAITEEMLELLATIGYDPEFGARPMNRAIQNTVEYAAAQAILKGTTQPGQQITLDVNALQEEAQEH